MIPEVIKQWDDKKHLLEEYFKTTIQDEYAGSYKSILEKVITYVITNKDEYEYNAKGITEIDDGDYQGTKIFLIPLDTYQPSASDYLITNTYYGSCSGCDTLQAISYKTEEVPNEEELKEYMLLALHLVQKMKYITE